MTYLSNSKSHCISTWEKAVVFQLNVRTQSILYLVMHAHVPHISCNNYQSFYKRHAMICLALDKPFHQVQKPMLSLYVTNSHKTKGILVCIKQ